VQYWDRTAKKVRAIGLGSVHDVSLSKARELAEDWRRDLKAGTAVLPSRARRPQFAQQAAAASAEPAGETFGEVAAIFPQQNASKWVASERLRYARLVDKHLLPSLGSRPYTSISEHDIIAILKPIWKGPAEKPGSAVRSIAERVLNMASSSRVAG
jgi:hypothetical protein